MGHTSVVKHKIKLDNYTPFKERYCRIPPNLFDEVRNHLKEMLEIGALQCSSSPRASTEVLIRKKDGSLQFCIDLRCLNARTIKDAYSLPHIKETRLLGRSHHLHLFGSKEWILAGRDG